MKQWLSHNMNLGPFGPGNSPICQRAATSQAGERTVLCTDGSRPGLASLASTRPEPAGPRPRCQRGPAAARQTRHPLCWGSPQPRAHNAVTEHSGPLKGQRGQRESSVDGDQAAGRGGQGHDGSAAPLGQGQGRADGLQETHPPPGGPGQAGGLGVVFQSHRGVVPGRGSAPPCPR